MQWILTVSLVRSGLCSVWVRLPHSRGARIRNQERSCQFPPFLVHLLSPAGAAAKSLQSCLTLCDPIDGSPPGSSVPGILQARTLEWGAKSFSGNSCRFPEKLQTKYREFLQALHPISPNVNILRIDGIFVNAERLILWHYYELTY